MRVVSHNIGKSVLETNEKSLPFPRTPDHRYMGDNHLGFKEQIIVSRLKRCYRSMTSYDLPFNIACLSDSSFNVMKNNQGIKSFAQVDYA